MSESNQKIQLWGEIAGWGGTTLSIIFFVSPLFSIIDLMKEKLTVSDFPGLLLIASTMNCILWVAKGIIDNKLQMWLCNAIGCSFSIIWTTIYVYYFAEQKIAKGFLYNLIVYATCGGLFAFLYFIIKNGEIIGYIAMVINVIMYFAPGQKILTVIKDKNPKLLPIHTSIIGLINCISWFIYGMYINDLAVMVPNGLGILFAILQIGAWIYAKFNQNETPEVEEWMKGEGEQKEVEENAPLFAGSQEKEEDDKKDTPQSNQDKTKDEEGETGEKDDNLNNKNGNDPNKENANQQEGDQGEEGNKDDEDNN